MTVNCGGIMTDFKSWMDFRTFQRTIRHDRRFVYTKETEVFLEAVRRSSHLRSADVSAGSIWWRAQLGNSWRDVGDEERGSIEIQCAYPPERMIPLASMVGDGRANSDGIPCLYLGSDDTTAISETRPWVGSYVSTAQFEIARDLKIVDCAEGHDKSPLFIEEPGLDERTKAVWHTIDRAFAEPVTSSDSRNSYLPTQILAELFKDEGFDGIGYKSSCSTGYNLALFNCDDARLLSCGLQRIKSVTLDFDDADQRYYIK